MINYVRNVRAVSGASQITGGGIISLGGFTLTVPATGTAALLGASNIFTQPQIMPVGDSTNPGLAFATSTGTGMYLVGAGDLAFSSGSIATMMIDYFDSVRISNGMSISWSSSLSAAGTSDLTMLRDGSGFFSIVKDSALTNAPAPHTLRHNTSGTAAAGFGLSILVQGESSTTADQDMASIVTTWATATHASRKARVVVNAYDTAVREVMRGEASGTAPLVGFLGAAAVARTSAYTPTNVTTDRAYDADAVLVAELADVVGTLIADLQAFGLLG